MIAYKNSNTKNWYERLIKKRKCLWKSKS